LPLPRGPSPVGFSYLDGYFLTNSSEHPAEAYEWMKFLVSRIEAANGSLPPLQSQIQSSEFEQANPEMGVIAQQMPADTFFIGFDTSQNEIVGQAIGYFYEAVSQVIQGSVSPAKALEEAQLKAEELFATR
jgi:ABC-type glycerol-3-phosphate transport system substrate-binding protein